jgi:succinate-semialdehyde dehydrogenase/glutarate-semialdehyde dehydrogenase
MKRDDPIGELATQFVEGPLALKDPMLLRRQAFVNGEGVNAHGSRTYPVSNPADGKTLAQVPDMGADEARAAIEAANRAWPAWRSKTAKERGAILRKWFDVIMANQEDLARILTAEQGKPLAESRGEVAFGAAFIDWYAEEAKRITGEVLSTYSADRRSVLLKQPVGVVGAITPWNFPSAMVTRKCAPASAAGCTVVLKPAEDTPLSCLALTELAVRAGMPAGVINVVTGRAQSAPAIGLELTTNKLVRKISFTGSTEVGKILLRQATSTVNKVSLELGGNAPFVVFDDADLDRAVIGAMGSKFRNMGQTCVCANRLYVQEGVYDAFSKKLVEAVKKLKVGAGWEPDVTQGPLIKPKPSRRSQSTSPTPPSEVLESLSAAGATIVAPCTSSQPYSSMSRRRATSAAKRPSGRLRLFTGSKPRRTSYGWRTTRTTGWPAISTPRTSTGPGV